MEDPAEPVIVLRASSKTHLWWAAAALVLCVGGVLLGRSIAPSRGIDPDTLPVSVADPATQAVCLKVLDGDTIRVTWQGETEDVRILGIDCPETKRGKKLLQQSQSLHLKEDYVLNYGKIAKKTTQNWLLNRNVALVFPNDKVKRDSFGRLLAYVEEQGVDIGERLLAGGNAFLWDSQHPRRETYNLLVEEAKRQKKGVWRNRDPPQESTHP